MNMQKQVSMYRHRLKPRALRGAWKGEEDGSKSLKSLEWFETVRFENVCDSFIQNKFIGDFIVCFATVQEEIS